MTPDGWPETVDEAIAVVDAEIDRELTTADYHRRREPPARRRLRIAADLWCRTQRHRNHPSHDGSRSDGPTCDSCHIAVRQALRPAPKEWQDPEGNYWLVEMRWAELAGRSECVGFTIQSYRGDDDPGMDVEPVRSASAVQPLRATTLRALPVASLIDEARAGWAWMLGDEGPWVSSDRSKEAKRKSRREAFQAPGGRRHKLTGPNGVPLSAEQALEEVARVYKEAWDPGIKDRTGRVLSPTEAVASVFGLSKSGAANRVARARKAGLLPATSRGKASGGPIQPKRGRKS